ncbi:MAG: DUF1294 domain-containing protein [Campylobacteraceae bacterium]|nr:DUF1294 domain-containing protein [Campylobacteraceae bacterium]
MLKYRQILKHKGFDLCCFGLRVFLLLSIVGLSFLLSFYFPFFPALGWYGALITNFSFLLMGIDKYLAIKERKRIPEVLFASISLVGGVYGVWFGMWVFKHKFKDANFVLTHGFIAFLWLLGIMLFWKYGNSFTLWFES